MFKRLACLISFLVMLALACNASADLVAHWKLDEGSGNTVYDSSSYGNDGTFKGDPQWVAGYYGGALDIDGTDDNIDCGNDDSLNIADEITLSAWINMAQRPDVDTWYTIPWKEGAYSMYLYGADNTVTTLAADFWLDTGRADIWNGPDIDIPPNDWTHIAVTFNSTDFEFYVNGEHDYTQNEPATIEISAINLLFTENGSNFKCLVDDVRIYNHALTQAEILAAMEGGEEYPYVLSPEPTDGALIEDTWANLSWRAGDFAVSHDVYIGDNFDDVNNGAEGTFLGNQAATELTVGFPGFPVPDGLVPGTTYYWRIDEVNDTEPNSPWKGPIWSFSIPPKTAYFPDPANEAEGVSVDVQLSWTGGFGSKLHSVYFGDNFDDVNNAAGGPSQGITSYDPGTLKMAKTYYWRVDEFDVVETHKGNVWSFTTEGAVTALDPANGAVDVTQTPVLTWAPGLGASHEIYFGTDAGSLELKGSGNLGSESYDPGELAWDTTYYWRVDEANNANADSPWTGPLWSFTTANFLIIDDMESYNDLDPAEPGSNRIFLAWIDGFDNPAVNGSVVGYANPPFAEQTIVHGGLQSMPFAYDNAVGKSEATLTLTTNKDWTVNGVNRLTIWYRGGSANAAETMYAMLNGSASVDNENPDAAQASRWTEWNIDLQAFADHGVNLANVTSITLGLRSVAGGTGMMYF
ncbi:MAG: LamG domain-containing protein, partial [Planctomycetes bacterium]|nr:LamG domain-containing protein [Planctomycetota bacterium]